MSLAEFQQWCKVRDETETKECCVCDRARHTANCSSFYICDFVSGRHRHIDNCKYYQPLRYASVGRCCCVYMHETPDGKRYIGTTSLKPTQRWCSNGNGYKKMPRFYKAIQKFGWDNIKHEILLDNLTYEEAIKAEHEYIALFHTYIPKYGYNVLR